MLIKMLITFISVLLLFAGWLLVQHSARRFARKYPELGPMREEGEGCGSSCNCQNNGKCNKAPEIYIND